MNQRIDKLMVKAGAYFGGEGVDYSNFDPKKFAELIVRECADIAKHHVMNISTYADAEFVEEQIGKHFGVEE
jgi:hypothetical protein